MARLIIMRIALGPGKYDAGDIVTVHEDGWVWGRYESLSIWMAYGWSRESYPAFFYNIDVTHTTVSDVLPYMETEIDSPRRRNVTFSVAGLPDIETTFAATVSRGQFFGRMANKEPIA